MNKIMPKNRDIVEIADLKFTFLSNEARLLKKTLGELLFKIYIG